MMVGKEEKLKNSVLFPNTGDFEAISRDIDLGKICQLDEIIK